MIWLLTTKSNRRCAVPSLDGFLSFAQMANVSRGQPPEHCGPQPQASPQRRLRLWCHGVSLCQVIGSFDAGWPQKLTEGLFRPASMLDFDVDVINVGCIASSAWTTDFSVQMALPMVIVLVYCAAEGVRLGLAHFKGCEVDWRSSRARVVEGSLQFMNVVRSCCPITPACACARWCSIGCLARSRALAALEKALRPCRARCIYVFRITRLKCSAVKRLATERVSSKRTLASCVGRRTTRRSRPLVRSASSST